MGVVRARDIQEATKRLANNPQYQNTRVYLVRQKNFERVDIQ